MYVCLYSAVYKNTVNIAYKVCIRCVAIRMLVLISDTTNDTYVALHFNAFVHFVSFLQFFPVIRCAHENIMFAS